MIDNCVRAVFYARVSTEEEKQVNALEKQIQENRDVIQEMGWELVDEYIDEGKSGTTTKRRNEYKRLLEDLQEDKFDVLVCKDQDRLQRNTLDWYLFVDRIVSNEIKLYIYLDHKFFKPAEDALITGIKAIIAEEYSRNLSKKLNNANAKRIERAVKGEAVSAMGNGKSLGYVIEDGKWVKVPHEIEICELIWDLYEKYDSIRKTRDDINNMGYTNSVGKPFTSESISRILKNEKAKGIIVMGKHHHDFDKKKIVKRPEEEWVRIPAPELAYVSEERFDRVQARLKAKSVNGRGRNVGRDPLSGKLYCSKCGAVLWRRESSHKNKDGEKVTYYHWVCSAHYAKGDTVCTGTGTTTVAIRDVYRELAEDVEVDRKAVKSYFTKWLKDLKATLSDVSANDRLQKDIDKLEIQRTKLLEMYLEEIISKEDYKAKYNDLESRIEEKKRLLAPVEENEDIKEIERVLANLDTEIDEYMSNLNLEESKIEFLIEHTKKITVLENKGLMIELDLVAGAIIAGKSFLLYVHDTMPLPHGPLLLPAPHHHPRPGSQIPYRFCRHLHRGDR
ncbi:MAG: recombinase family protein [Clostridiales bacterium]|nr:recombinase family protein [Clostridiales bacterium]